jgi:ABC-type spermidine/putrescine transport system permease subunit II
VLTNDVIDLSSVSDDEKPKAKEDSSSIHAIVDTIIISSLLGKKRTPLPQQQLNLLQRKLHLTLQYLFLLMLVLMLMFMIMMQILIP